MALASFFQVYHNAHGSTAQVMQSKRKRVTQDHRPSKRARLVGPEYNGSNRTSMSSSTTTTTTTTTPAQTSSCTTGYDKRQSLLAEPPSFIRLSPLSTKVAINANQYASCTDWSSLYMQELHVPLEPSDRIKKTSEHGRLVYILTQSGRFVVLENVLENDERGNLLLSKKRVIEGVQDMELGSVCSIVVGKRLYAFNYAAELPFDLQQALKYQGRIDQVEADFVLAGKSIKYLYSPHGQHIQMMDLPTTELNLPCEGEGPCFISYNNGTKNLSFCYNSTMYIAPVGYMQIIATRRVPEQEYIEGFKRCKFEEQTDLRADEWSTLITYRSKACPSSIASLGPYSEAGAKNPSRHHIQNLIESQRERRRSKRRKPSSTTLTRQDSREKQVLDTVQTWSESELKESAKQIVYASLLGIYIVLTNSGNVYMNYCDQYIWINTKYPIKHVSASQGEESKFFCMTVDTSVFWFRKLLACSRAFKDICIVHSRE